MSRTTPLYATFLFLFHYFIIYLFILRLSVHILLNLVTEGKISLIEAPPLHGKDPARNWSSSELRSVTLNAHELLERCLASFAARFSNISSSQLSAAMEAEISADLLRMQTQPNLINNYRRYVIVTAASQVESNRDGVCSIYLIHQKYLLNLRCSSNGRPYLNLTSKIVSPSDLNNLPGYYVEIYMRIAVDSLPYLTLAHLVRILRI